MTPELASQRLRDAITTHSSPATLENYIVKGGAVDPINDMDHAPLSLAAARGLTEHLLILLSHGADPNCHNGEPLLDAVAAGHSGCVDILLSHGANPRLDGRFHVSDPLASVCAMPPIDDDQAVELEAITHHLIRHGADINAARFDDGNPVQIAIREGNHAAYRALREAGADGVFEMETRFTPFLTPGYADRYIREHCNCFQAIFINPGGRKPNRIAAGLVAYSPPLTNPEYKPRKGDPARLFFSPDTQQHQPKPGDIMLMQIHQALVQFPFVVEAVWNDPTTPPYQPRFICRTNYDMMKAACDADPQGSAALADIMRDQT